jgi:DNA-binding NarL/FixJ family response regulator
MSFEPPTATSIRVLLVDDQAMARIGIRQIITSDPHLAVVGEAGDGFEAHERVRELQPDVVLMDVRMPRCDGITATAAIIGDDTLAHRPRIVMLTTFDLDDHVFGALRAGAAGFLLKDADPNSLIRAVHTVAAGDALIAPAVTQRLIVAALAGLQAPSSEAENRPVDILLRTLSDREREVLVLLADGLSNAQLAEKLFVSETTIKSHVSNVLLKLRLESRVQAVVYAYENGLVAPGRHRS